MSPSAVAIASDETSDCFNTSNVVRPVLINIIERLRVLINIIEREF